MQIVTPEWLQPLAEAFAQEGYDLLLVGGYVRNALLGLPFSDIDVCSAARPEQAGRIAHKAGAQVIEKQPQLGTMEFIWDGNKVEYTPLRTESYGEGGAHRPEQIAFTDDRHLDALRRDFRCNALYADIRSGEVHDPLGGVADVQTRTLRACRPDAEHTLRDDGLRLLRMARFAAQLGFTLDPALFRAARACAGNIKDIAPARIAQEMTLICLADTKYGISRFGVPAHYRALRMLDEAGILGAMYPELMQGKGLMQSPQFHAYDVFNHNLHTFEVAPPALPMRLACLLHDVAKPQQFELNGGKMYGHDEAGAVMARDMLVRTGFSHALVDEACTIIARHMFDLDGRAKEKTCRLRFAQWGFAFAETLILMRRCDIAGSGKPPSERGTPEKWEAILQQMRREGAIDSLDDLAIDGRDIMQATGLHPGASIGKIKRLLFERVVMNPAMNNRGILIREAKNLAGSFRN